MLGLNRREHWVRKSSPNVDAESTDCTMVWSDTLTQLKKEMENLQQLTVGFKGAKKTRRPGLSGRREKGGETKLSSNETHPAGSKGAKTETTRAVI
jgi:hypothetical protein